MSASKRIGIFIENNRISLVAAGGYFLLSIKSIINVPNAQSTKSQTEKRVVQN